MSNTVGYSLGCVTPVRYNLTQGEDATGNGARYSLGGCPPRTAYYEIPFSHVVTTGFDTVELTIHFAGKVRLWGSGTVEMIGGIRSTRAGTAYRVWVGPTPNTGDYHVVGTSTQETTWEEAYWVYHPNDGSYVHGILGADIGGAIWLQKLWSFQDGGWAFPITFDNFQTSEANMDGVITRSESAIICTGNASRTPSASAAWDWWGSVTPGETFANWVFSGYSGVNQVSTPTYTTTAAMTDSATTGILARWYSGSPYPALSDVTRICAVGPFYRPVYDPVVQFGIDPLGIPA